MGREDVLRMLREKKAAKEKAAVGRSVAQSDRAPASEVPSSDPVLVSAGSSPKAPEAGEEVQHISVPAVTGEAGLPTFGELANAPQSVPGKGKPPGPMTKKRPGAEPKKGSEPVRKRPAGEKVKEMTERPSVGRSSERPGAGVTEALHGRLKGAVADSPSVPHVAPPLGHRQVVSTGIDLRSSMIHDPGLSARLAEAILLPKDREEMKAAPPEVLSELALDCAVKVL